MSKVSIVFLIFLSAFSGSSAANNTAETFFEKYIELGEKFSTSVADLYRDSAKIHVYRNYPHGLERAMELTGTQWKSLITKAMPVAKAQNDKSTFSNIVITKKGNKYRIKADRYSVRKCYTDKGYYMVVQKNTAGNFGIIEEYMETQPKSDC